MTMSNANKNAPLMKPKDAAHWLGLKKHALLAMARQQLVPSVRLNTRVVRFRPADLRAFAAQNLQAGDALHAKKS